jgi:hypothetical protein
MAYSFFEKSVYLVAGIIMFLLQGGSENDKKF